MQIACQDLAATRDENKNRQKVHDAKGVAADVWVRRKSSWREIERERERSREIRTWYYFRIYYNSETRTLEISACKCMRSKTARGLTQEGGEDRWWQEERRREDVQDGGGGGRTVSDTFKMSRRDGTLESSLVKESELVEDRKRASLPTLELSKVALSVRVKKCRMQVKCE